MPKPGWRWLLVGWLLVWGGQGWAVEIREPQVTQRCISCHGWREPVATPRHLGPPHAALPLRHGNLWCLSCHVADDPEKVAMPQGEAVPLQQGSLSCKACHAAVANRWTLGSHGKRLDSWRGERIWAGCRVCHNAHTPAMPPVRPDPPPRPPWERRYE